MLVKSLHLVKSDATILRYYTNTCMEKSPAIGNDLLFINKPFISNDSDHLFKV